MKTRFSVLLFKVIAALMVGGSAVSSENTSKLALADAYLSAVKEYEFDKLDSLVHENFIFADVNVPESLGGNTNEAYKVSDYAEFVEELRGRMPEQDDTSEKLDIHHKFESGNTVVYVGRIFFSSTLDGSLVESNAMVIETVSVLNGKIAEHRIYADYSAIEETMTFTPIN